VAVATGAGLVTIRARRGAAVEVGVEVAVTSRRRRRNMWEGGTKKTIAKATRKVTHKA